MPPTINVLIADDHAIVREGLKQIASQDRDIVVAGEATTGNEAISTAREGKFDVVILDLSFPDRSGLDVLAHIKAARPELPVLILSMQSEQEFALRALRAGASGYLEKKSAPAQLVAAIKRLAQGKRYLSPELAEQLAFELERPAVEHPHDLLSEREFQVFLMLGAGKSVRQIAEQLNLSVKTVNNHRANILQKMGMKSNAELIRYAIHNKLVE